MFVSPCAGSNRKWRLMALGNGWVPHQAYSAWRDLAALAQHAQHVHALPSAPKKRTSGIMRDGKVYGTPDMRVGRQVVLDRLWPTPRATEWKGVGPYGSKSHEYRVEEGYLDATVQDVEGRTGVLNPAWVEVLMGWPMGSTLTGDDL